MNRTLYTLPLALMLSLGTVACDPGSTQGAETQQLDSQPSENDVLGRRVVRGTISSEAEALNGDGDASSAEEVHVTSVEEDGSTTSHGSATIEADGRFELEVEGATRTFLVEARDAQGSLVAAAIAHADAASDEVVEVGEVTTTTSIEAMVWIEVVAQAGFGVVSSAEVRAHIDTATAEAAHAWARAHGEGRAAFEALASAVFSASSARLEGAAEAGLSLEGSSRSRFHSELLGTEGTADFGMALDAALSAEGASPELRSDLAARSEATFRAVVEAAFDRSESEGEALIDAASEASARIEARAQAEAWAAIAASAEIGAELALEIAETFDALAEMGEEGREIALEAQAELDAMAWAAVELVAGIEPSLELLVELELSSEADASAAADAMEAWLTEVRAGLEASLEAAAEAEASDGSVSAEAMASASAEAFAEATTEIERIAAIAEASGAGEASLRVAASALLSLGR